MKYAIFLMIALCWVIAGYSQALSPAAIDSLILIQRSIPDTYQYDYSALEKEGNLYTRFELTADTTTKQLLRAIYTEEGKTVWIIHYYFYNNQLVKVESMNRDDIRPFPFAVYYFCADKLILQKGKNISLENKKLFGKISRVSLPDQGRYWLSQFDYFANRRTEY